MGLGEKTPLRGSQEHVPYVFMTDPNRAYKKKVRQLQCYLCSAIFAVFALAILVTVAYSVDNDEDILEGNGTLARTLQSASLLFKEDSPSVPVDHEAFNGQHLKLTQDEFPSEVDFPGIDVPPQNKPADFSICGDEAAEDKFECLKSKYRSADGVCNNLNNPLTWGVSKRPYSTLLPPDYCNGYSSPRCAESKSDLPSAFNVSQRIYPLNENDLREKNVIQILWSHFVYQDLVDSEPSQTSEDCCKLRSYLCFPMEISENSPIYSELNSTCLHYARADYYFCSPPGKRLHLNEATSYLDGSAIYGSSIGIQKKLRKFENGQLVLFITPEKEYLPIRVSEDIKCNISRNGGLGHCLDNEFTCLSQRMNISSINHMLANHHNFIATQLAAINPKWDDEKIFQNARRIVTAQIQHITYNEFLESTLGNDQMKSFGENNEAGYFEEYSENIDATVTKSFSSAFNLINTLLPGLREAEIQKKGPSPCQIYALAYQIQRERDHGLPGYTKWREYCKVGKVSNFDELSESLGTDTVDALRDLYQNVTDIDLFVGLFAEMPRSGRILGPVGTCIVSDQFRRTKTGDRFWFETSQRPQYFTREQLAEIRKTTLSRIICDNSKHLMEIQLNNMNDNNDSPVTLCSALPHLNLSLWADNVGDKYNPTKIDDKEPTAQFNRDADLQNSSQIYMRDANNYILTFNKGGAKVDGGTKIATSFTVQVLNATIKVGDEVVYDEGNARPPFTIPIDGVADTGSYNPSAIVSFSASYEDDILQGTVSLPMKNSFKDSFVRIKKVVDINFTAGVTIKWSGSFNLEPKKKYSCTVMFQSYSKMSPLASTPVAQAGNSNKNLKLGDSGETCSFLMVGTFYHRPFYCSVTPWWCMEGLIFFWTGEAKLIFVKTTPPQAEPNSLTASNESAANKSTIMLQKTNNEVTEKTFASVTVLRGKMTGQFNGEEATTILDGSPPIEIALDNFVTPNGFDTSVTATWSATPIDDRVIEGQFSVPYFPSIEDGNFDRRKFTANFSVHVIYKFGGSIGIIDPSKTYTCKVMFQENKKLSYDKKLQPMSNDFPVTMKGKTPFGESCSITVSGTFYKPSMFCFWCSDEKIFYWSGDIELALKYKYNSSEVENGLPIKKLMQPKEITSAHTNQPVNQNPVLGKGGEYLVNKTYASVTVLNGKISGQFNGEEVFEVLNGSPPAHIYLDNFVNPNSFDASVEATWTATPMGDSSVVGTFSVPYFPSEGDTSGRRKFSANFSVSLVYKYGGSIGIIDPSKTYTCKVMFQQSKKSANPKLLETTDSAVPLKGKTPFGESCTITISGSLHEKIFFWNGDVEVAFKYKYNVTNNDIVDNSVKKLELPKLNNGLKTVGLSNMSPYQAYAFYGRRYGGKVSSGWLQINTGGLFSSKKTVWAGDIPFEIQLPVFWAPSNDDGSELSDVYGHAILWSASIFQATIQGYFSLPQYIGHGPAPSVKWISGKFSFQLEPNPYAPLYDVVVPGVQYSSNLHFHKENSPNTPPFSTPTFHDPTQADVGSGIRAPIILLGRHTAQKTFIWNGTFIVDFSRTAKDLYYG